jgi:hypothetical protein
VSVTTPTVGLADWGPLVIGSDIDDFVVATIKTWAPTYFTQTRKERGLVKSPALPRTYSNTFMGQEFFDHQLPAVICTTANLVVTKGGSNMIYEGAWPLRVATVVRAKRPPVTRFLASLYEGTMRRLVAQKVRGGPVNDIHYEGFRYEEVPDSTGQGRYALAAISLFQVFTDQVLQPYAGPDQPDMDEYLDEATVVEVDIEVLGEHVVIDGN